MPQPIDRLTQLIIDAIKAELAEDAGRRPTLDRDPLRARKTDLLALVASAEPRKRDGAGWKPDPSAMPVVVRFGHVLEYGHAWLTRAIADWMVAVPKHHLYTDEAKDVVATVRELFAGYRERFQERLPNNQAGQALREFAFEKVVLPSCPPFELLDRGTLFAAALRDAEREPLLLARGFEPPLMLEEIDRELGVLQEELDRGFGPAPRKGEGAGEVQEALRFLEVAYQRVVGWLKDHGCAELAQKVDAFVPRKARRAAKPEVKPEVKPEPAATPADGTPEPVPTS